MGAPVSNRRHTTCHFKVVRQRELFGFFLKDHIKRVRPLLIVNDKSVSLNDIVREVILFRINAVFKRRGCNIKLLNRKGIPYVKMNRSVRYALSDVIRFMESRKVLIER